MISTCPYGSHVEWRTFSCVNGTAIPSPTICVGPRSWDKVVIMARTILSTRLGRHLEHDEFWSTVVLFLAGNPLIHPTQVGPMIDYLHNMRFASRRIIRAAATGRRLAR